MNNQDSPPSVASEGAASAKASTSGLAVPADAEDSRLVERSLAGEAEAFEQLFTKHRQRLFSVAWRLLHDEDSALDVVQDAFVKAYEELSKLRGDGRFYPWLRRIAINLSIDRLRHLKRSVEVGLDERRVGTGEEESEEPAAVLLVKSGAESPVRRAELSEFNAAFAEAVQKLSEDHRAVFMLHSAEGMSYKEIADALDCNIGTVMSRLFYARRKLAALLADLKKSDQ